MFTAVTLSNKNQSKFGLDPHCACYDQTFLLDPNLILFITDNEKANKEPNAISAYQKDICDYLTGESSHRTHAEKTEIMGYQILETLQKTERFTEYLCKQPLFMDKRYKIREYPLDFPGKTADELIAIRNRATNSVAALAKLSHCPNIIETSGILNTEQTAFYEISEYLDECTLRARLHQKTFT